MFARRGRALTNFSRTLPAEQSELAQQLVKDRYSKPEFAGKMNFYLSVIDHQLRHPNDQPTIGIILCRGRNEVIVEYALRDMSKPMGVAEYRFSTALPKRLQRELPTTEDLAPIDTWLDARPTKCSTR